MTEVSTPLHALHHTPLSFSSFSFKVFRAATITREISSQYVPTERQVDSVKTDRDTNRETDKYIHTYTYTYTHTQIHIFRQTGRHIATISQTDE